MLSWEIPPAQTFLRLAGVDFRVLPSNNHASPTGALPFLIPYSPSSPLASSTPESKLPTKTQTPAPAPAPIPSSKLEQWVLHNSSSSSSNSTKKDPPPGRLDGYEALLDHRLRPAWLHALYLSRGNAALLSRLYAAPASASPAVRAALRHQLRRAAETEIHRLCGSADPGRAVYAGAREAFGALEAALAWGGDGGDGEGSGDKDEGRWFFGAPEPGLFDAAVFSYTHLLLPDSDGGGGGLAWEARGYFEGLPRSGEAPGEDTEEVLA